MNGETGDGDDDVDDDLDDMGAADEGRKARRHEVVTAHRVEPDLERHTRMRVDVAERFRTGRRRTEMEAMYSGGRIAAPSQDTTRIATR